MTTTPWLLRESKLPKAPSWTIVFGFALLWHLIFTQTNKLLMVALIAPLLIGSILIKYVKVSPALKRDIGVLSGALYLTFVIGYLAISGIV